jgi:N utilization substance protein A
MSKSEFELAITQLAAERGLPKEKVVAAVEAALASAYRKESQAVGQNILVRLDMQTGAPRLYIVKTVVPTVEDPKKEIDLKEARRLKADVKEGDEIEQELNNPQSARIAALTAKQVVLQRLREAERDLIYEDYLNKEGEMLAGRVERSEPGRLVISLGRAEAYLPREEQVPTERYRSGQTMQFYMLEVRRTPKGPELILSRTHRNLLRRLLEREVPEIYHGAVEIKAIAREAGSRSKVAVAARQDGVDPVGSCIGPRGVRIQNVVNELQGEKIDIFRWDKEVGALIANALNPAQVMRVDLNEADKVATVIVPDNQLSLAIGRDGQTARLTAKLTGWRIDLKGAAEYEALEAVVPQPQEPAAPAVEATKVVEAPQPAAPKVEQPVAAVAPAPRPAPVVAPPPVIAEPQPALVAEREPEPEPAAPVRAAATIATPPAPAAVPTPAPPSEEPAGQPTEDVWNLDRIVRQAPPPEAGVIRFAEDLIPGRGRPREGAGREKARDDAARSKPKKARRGRGGAPEGEE